MAPRTHLGPSKCGCQSLVREVAGALQSQKGVSVVAKKQAEKKIPFLGSAWDSTSSFLAGGGGPGAGRDCSYMLNEEGKEKKQRHTGPAAGVGTGDEAGEGDEAEGAPAGFFMLVRAGGPNL